MGREQAGLRVLGGRRLQAEPSALHTARPGLRQRSHWSRLAVSSQLTHRACSGSVPVSDPHVGRSAGSKVESRTTKLSFFPHML